MPRLSSKKQSATFFSDSWSNAFVPAQTGFAENSAVQVCKVRDGRLLVGEGIASVFSKKKPKAAALAYIALIVSGILGLKLLSPQ